MSDRDGFTPLDCKWCYWENHVTTDESCICLHDACKTGDPRRVFALACDYDETLPVRGLRGEAMSEQELICNRLAYGFMACDCPDYGSSDCPRALPGAKCLMDLQYAREVMEAKTRYYERKAVKQ